jgi:hypothetical protein
MISPPSQGRFPAPLRSHWTAPAFRPAEKRHFYENDDLPVTGAGFLADGQNACQVFKVPGFLGAAHAA